MIAFGGHRFHINFLQSLYITSTQYTQTAAIIKAKLIHTLPLVINF